MYWPCLSRGSLNSLESSPSEYLPMQPLANNTAPAALVDVFTGEPIPDISTPLANALQLAERGFHVFPTNGKVPRVKFKDAATRDIGQIRAWDAQFLGCNWGVYCGRFGNSESLLAIDVDVKDGKPGNASLAALEAKHGKLPATFTQYTPTGGRHLVYSVPKPIKATKVNSLGEGLDTRADGGYVVAAGGVVETGHYTTNGDPVVPAPAWLIALCTEKANVESAEAPVDLERIDQEAAKRRAAEYLDSQAPRSLKGQGGDATAYKVACRVRDYGVNEATAVELMLDSKWNAESPPGWSVDKLRVKVHNAYAYASGAAGNAAPEAVFKPVPVQPKQSIIKTPVDTFETNNKGRIKQTLSNVRAALSRPESTGFDLALDTFRDNIVLAPHGTKEWRPLTDRLRESLRELLERQGFESISDREMRAGLLRASESHQFDAGQVWLEGLKWDGTSRVNTFASVYLGATDTPYTQAVSRYLWTALAGRILKPGCKADMAPVLVSDQGWQKSAAIAALVPDPEFFTELELDAGGDTLTRLIRGKLVCELAELSGIGRADIEWLKQFITRQHEEWVPKYMEHTHRYPRRCLFIGTSNRDDFLVDETGNRRWLPFRLDRKCDVEAIVRDREQLWAEGAEMFSEAGIRFADAEKLAVAEHEQFTYHDSWETTIETWLDTPVGADANATTRPREREWITTADVLRHALHIEPARASKQTEMRVGRVLSGMGYRNERVSENGKRFRAWVAA
jgi:hypothetical protein